MKTYTLRLDDDLYERMKKHIQQQDRLTISAFLRSAIEESIQDDFDVNELMKVRRNLAGIGNNMNQLTKIMYSQGLESDAFDELRKEIYYLRNSLKKVLRK